MKTFSKVKKCKKFVPIFLSAGKNDFPSLDVALISIKDNISKKRAYAVYILHDGAEECLQQTIARLADKKFKINFIDVSGYEDSAAAYRAILPTLFPKLDKALYFNSNVVALSDVAELYSASFGNAYLMDVKEPTIAHTPKLLDYNVSRKPWHYTDVPYQDYFWKYAVQSAFYEEFLSRLKGFAKAN